MHNSTQSSSVTTSQPSNTIQPPHLLLCISVGQSGTKVYQEPMNGVNSDSTLFSFMNEAYRTHRRIRSWICLRTVTSIDLVRVSIRCLHTFYREYYLICSSSFSISANTAMSSFMMKDVGQQPLLARVFLHQIE